MPRANRYFLPDFIWHITHRCHKKEFLLKFARDRECWIGWLFEAKKRYGLCVLNYVVTSNHIHLLVKDTNQHVIAKSLQLIAGRTAQEYNQRKQRKGAFWEDRYHATAISSDEHFLRCLVYIDMNMVRAGVVQHPAEWAHGGYREIQQPPKRYRIIDIPALMALGGFNDIAAMQQQLRQWLNEELEINNSIRDKVWSESLAVGSEKFVEKVQTLLGAKATKRKVIEIVGKHALREQSASYNVVSSAVNPCLRLDNRIFWDD
ncbi:MAG: putative transposase [Motiliproteus sp.]|jgi:putative transposase